MINTKLRKQKIIELKKELTNRYIYLMCIIFFFYSLYFLFYIKDNFMGIYLLSATLTLTIICFFLQKNYCVQKIVRGYLLIAPLYNIIVILKFWPYSVASFVWLVPIPLGAYIFFSKKEVIFFSSYSLLIIFTTIILAFLFPNFYIRISKEKVLVLDTFLFISNIIICAHLIHYKDKIRSLEIISEIEIQKKIELPISLDKKELEQYQTIFKKIDILMTEKELYKNPNLNISVLSAMIKVNSSYISRCIRHQGFDNFNSYINSHRIEHVTRLIQNTDLEKVTLLFIYTDAGYKSQSTFNRVFKEIKGITPSEYIQINKPL